MGEVRLPRAFKPLFTPSRYKAFYGGRGSGKSHAFATALVLKAAERPVKILCAREIQKSIAESVKSLLDSKIREAGLSDAFRSLETEIRGANGSLFVFQGLRSNPDAIKSMEGLDVAWVEEANRASARSLELLIPTVRGEGSELWFSWNPELPVDPVDRMFRGGNVPPDSIVRKVTWRDNPLFPGVLEAERLHDLATSPIKHDHVWEGGYRLAWEDVYFDGNRLVAMADDVMAPVAVGSLIQAGETVRFVVGVDPWLEVWEQPQEGEHYVCGADVSEGTSEGDQHSGHVLKRGLVAEQVARFAPNCGPDELGRRAVLVGKWYGQHKAVVPVAPERNNLGLAAVIAAQDTGYAHLFQYTEPGRPGHPATQRAGWVTTTASRPVMLSDLSAALLDGSVRVRSAETLAQLRTFVKTPSGKPEGAPGCHDDEVMGLAIAVQLLTRTKPKREGDLARSRAPASSRRGAGSWMTV